MLLQSAHNMTLTQFWVQVIHQDFRQLMLEKADVSQNVRAMQFEKQESASWVTAVVGRVGQPLDGGTKSQG